MKIFGSQVPFTNKAAAPVQKAANLSSVRENRGWFRVFESFSGAWQRNITIDYDLVLANPAIYTCMTLIASDISKLRVKLMEMDQGGIWTETTSPAFSPVLGKPNQYQTRNQFWECWMLSKLMRGNTYVLKKRDGRGIVVAMYILNPDRVTPMVADNGEVFYQLSTDNISGLEKDLMVPASEMIHDRFNCLFHPLVGTSPIYANAYAATQGMNIVKSSTQLFANHSQPGGILTVPPEAEIDEDAARKLKEEWQAAFTGDSSGKIAVLTEGLTYQKLALTAVEADLILQLKWTSEVICSTFHVPAYKAGIGDMPTYNNIESLNLEYYTTCLQALIEAAESCMDEGLGLDTPKDGRVLGTEFDIANLLRMDSVTQMEVLDKAKSIMTPDEQRRKLDLKATPGGNVVYRQQQDFSLEALAKRDAKEDPFGSTTAAPKPAAASSTAAKQSKSLLNRSVLCANLGLDSIPVPSGTIYIGTAS